MLCIICLSFFPISVRTIISAIVDAILDGDKKKRSEIPGINYADQSLVYSQLSKIDEISTALIRHLIF